MPAQSLEAVAKAMVAPGKGILAADESTGTIEKRLKSIQVENSEDNRRAYRDMLFTAKGLGQYISGVILYDETIRQKGVSGTPFVEMLQKNGILPGIKVDTGTKDLALCPGETVTEGLDNLPKRCAEYVKMGAKFAKWRAVINIGSDIPSSTCIAANAHALARYAAICQSAGLVPIVEPEVLMDTDHTIERCEEVTEWTLNAVYEALYLNRVTLEASVLKPSMVIAGKGCPRQADVAGRHRVPVGGAERRARHRAPGRDEQEPRQGIALAAVVLLRPRLAGGGAQGMERLTGQHRRGPGRAAAPLTHEQPGQRRPLQRRLGTPGAGGVILEPPRRQVRQDLVRPDCD